MIGAVIAFLFYWWWRAQRARNVADGVIDMVEQARGAINRNRFRRKVEGSTLASVDDPGVAAAALLYSVAALKRPPQRAEEQAIDEMLEVICRMGPSAREEAMAFAEWSNRQVVDTNEVIRRLTPLWLDRLEEPQRRELLGMAVRVAELGGPAEAAQSAVIRRLGEGLGLK